MEVDSQPQITQENPEKIGDGPANGNINGVSNGHIDKHHHSSHKDKHRDKDKDRHRDKDKHSSSKDHHRDKDRHKDKDRERSKDHKSSHRDKDHHSDKKDRSDKDKEHKDRSDKDKDKHRSSDKDKHHSSSDKHKSDKDKDRHHKSSSSKDHHRDKDKHHSSSSHDKDKHKHSSSSKDKDKEKDKHSSSHSKDKDGHKSKEHSSSSPKKEHSSSPSKGEHKDHKDSSSKHRDKDHHKSKDRHHDKDKSRDKDREKDKDKHRSDKSSDKDKSKHHHSSSSKDKKDRDHKEHKVKKEERSLTEIKVENDIKQEVKVELVKLQPNEFGANDNFANHYNNVSTASSCDYNYSQFGKDEGDFSGMDDNSQNQFANNAYSSDDDKPITMRQEPEEPSDPLAMDDEEVKQENNFKREISDGEDSDVPLAQRSKKVKKESSKQKKKAKKRQYDSEEEDEEEFEEKPKKKKSKTAPAPQKSSVKVNTSQSSVTSPGKKGGRKKKEEENTEVWKWWEEKKENDGTKWKFLEHRGPVFPPDYERIPENVKFYYDGKEMRLSKDAEEIAGFYARMIEHEYTSKEAFNKNFFKDWRKSMTDREREKIKDLDKCNFKPMHAYFMDQSEKNRNRTKEEKEALKQKNAEMVEEYGFCTIDGHKERIGNFRLEPPGLFRGRGEHPKMGMLKKRIQPEDVIVNCSKDSKWPEPPPGHKWKEVKHDNQVTWLATWTENVQGQNKYVMLNPSSKLKGEKDWQKYETARRLHKTVHKIREDYQRDWKSKEMRIRQRAVAMYFIDKLALRAGNEKDEDQADTVGCCSLRVEHIKLYDEVDGQQHVVEFDFLGKDSIRYYNRVPVEKRVYKNLQLFMEKKAPSDDLFDRLNTGVLNKHLQELMDGLTAKVFRTYNASITLQLKLAEFTNEDDSIPEKILSYNRANRAVAILCNHQRAVPKTHDKSMEKLKEKIQAKRDQIKEGERQVKDAKRDAKNGSVKEQVLFTNKKKQLEKMKEQLKRLEVQETDRDENKTIALGTSKLNYLDPRISVAWCKKFDVPIEKIYNKTQREKFRWAIDMAGPDYEF